MRVSPRSRPFRPLPALLLAAAAALMPLAARGQTEVLVPPAADPADVASDDAIVSALYDVISGAAGEARDWDRWRSLFLPEAHLVPVGVRRDGTVVHRVITPEAYATDIGPNLERTGFFERETHAVSERFGHIAHRFSTYESRRSADDAEPFARGINSIQLMFDGTRWWIANITWDSERPGQPVPQRYRGR